MNAADNNIEQSMTPLIDRLVSGDLDERQRTRLLNWLEAEPQRWRRCGLAFLEAQAWSQALADWPQAKHPQASSSDGVAVGSASLRRRTWRIAFVAASIFAAFALGMAADDFERVDSSSLVGISEAPLSNEPWPRSVREAVSSRTDPVLASVEVRSLSSQPMPRIHLPVVPSSTSSTDDGPHEISEYVRRQWERRGYRLEFERRYLFGTLPDGEEVAVPVRRVQISPLKPEIY